MKKYIILAAVFLLSLNLFAQKDKDVPVFGTSYLPAIPLNLKNLITWLENMMISGNFIRNCSTC